MVEFDLSTYSKQELMDLKQEIDQELAVRRRKNLKTAHNEVENIADKYGVTIADLISEIIGEPEEEVGQALYRHPHDPTKRWSGRGRRPNWVKEWQARGGSLDELRR